MQKIYLRGSITKAKDGEDFEFIASDETLDRMGEVIPIDSWDLRNYNKAPRLLVNHDYDVQSIVGKAESMRIEKGKLRFKPKFHEITELSKQVASMVKEGFLNTVSVGFLPHPPKKNGDRITNELLEVSLVSIPANPNALMTSLSFKSVGNDEMEKILEFIGEKSEEIIQDEIEGKKKEVSIVDFTDAESTAKWLNGKAVSEWNDQDWDVCICLYNTLTSIVESRKGINGEKGRSKVESRSQKILIRALQDINRESNRLLREIKPRVKS